MVPSIINFLIPLFMVLGIAWAITLIVRRGKTYLDAFNGPEYDPEKAIIKLAMKMKGKITVPDICAHTNLGVQEAKANIEHLTREGVFHRELSETGAKVFVLSDMASLEEKQNSTKVIE